MSERTAQERGGEGANSREGDQGRLWGESEGPEGLNVRKGKRPSHWKVMKCFFLRSFVLCWQQKKQMTGDQGMNAAEEVKTSYLTNWWQEEESVWNLLKRRLRVNQFVDIVEYFQWRLTMLHLPFSWQNTTITSLRVSVGVCAMYIICALRV